MIEITRYPQTTLSDGHVCKMSAAYNPMYLEVNRKDYTIIGSTSNSGFLQLFVNDVSDFVLAQRVYFVGKSSGGVVASGVAQIWEIGSNYIALLWTATNPTNAITTGWVNVQSDTKREVELSGSGFTSRRFSYNAFGVVKVYLTGIARELFAIETTEQDTGINIIPNLARVVDLRIEDIETGDTVDVNDSSNYYMIPAVKQAMSDNRMTEYEVYNHDGINSTAKYLTAMEKPVIFRGYPFKLYALTGENEAVLYNEINDGSITNTIFNSSERGIHSIPIEPNAGVRKLTSRIITGVTTEPVLDIGDGYQLDIGDGQNLNI